MTSTWRDSLQSDLGPAYQIRQELGGGGMSSTFIADETALGRSVVIKVLSPDLASGLNVDRFQREIHLAARLQHAFVVPLLSAGVASGHPWYTMPLVQGESLRARIAREGALTAGATARLIRDVAEALAYAHAQGVIHRDIKPDNILLSGSHALVTDFGVAKAISASTSAGDVTGIGVAIGTAAYMAPEQAAGDPACDHRADLYALGATAYEMLTGRQLFPHRSAAQMLAAHAVETPEPLASIAPDVPRDLAALVEQLLQKHPNDRPSRAQDVADLLTAMLTRWTSGELPPAVGQVTLVRALTFWGIIAVTASLAAFLGVRWLPIPEWILPLTVVVLLAGLPVVLLTAWLHRPARPLAMVPSVASTTTVGRMEAVARPHITWRRTRLAGLAAVGLVALIAAGWAGSRTLGVGPAATLVQQGWVDTADFVLVADFDTPGDSTLSDVVSDLMRTELARSAGIKLVPANRRGAALVALGRPRNARVFPPQAREVAVRANANIYLAGSVTSVGSGYLLRSTLHETTTGNELAGFRQAASNADGIIKAVDRMGRQIRDQLGGSLRDVRGAPALYFSVTPSLEAARLYTEGSRAADRGDQAQGVRLFERAVQVDTQFAMAYRRLSAYYSNVGNFDGAAWAAERAMRYRDKLPAGLALLVEATYYQGAAGYDPQKAIAAFERALETYGPNVTAYNNLGVIAARAREYEKGLAAYREAIKRDTTSIFGPLNITASMWQSGRTQETRDYVEQTLPRWFRAGPLVDLERAQLMVAAIRPDSVVLVLERMRNVDSMPPFRRAERHALLANAYRAQGRLTLATAHDLRSATLAPVADIQGGISSAALGRADIAIHERGNGVEARRILDSLMTVHPPGSSSPLAYRWHDLAYLYAAAGDVAKAKSLLARYEQLATPVHRSFQARGLNTARGWIAIAERRYADAISAFRAADVGECATCPLPQLAHAYDLAEQPDSAIAIYERYLTVPTWPRNESDGRHLAQTYKRLAELHEQRGDVAKARGYYGRFLALWANADAELQPTVAQVRRRLASLRAE